MIATGKELIKQQIADFSRQKEQRREDAQMLILRRIESENIGKAQIKTPFGWWRIGAAKVFADEF